MCQLLYCFFFPHPVPQVHAKVSDPQTVLDLNRPTMTRCGFLKLTADEKQNIEIFSLYPRDLRERSQLRDRWRSRAGVRLALPGDGIQEWSGARLIWGCFFCEFGFDVCASSSRNRLPAFLFFFSYSPPDL